MISVQTQLRLARFIKATADLESSVEITRQSLAENEGFEPQLAFKYLDASNQNFLSEKELKHFLSKLEIKHNPEDINFFIKQFSSQGNSQLNYSDFESIVLSASRYDLRQQAISRKRFKAEELPSTAVWVLGRLFQKAIEGTKKLETLQNELIISNDWNTTEAFMAIDRRRSGSLTPGATLEFLKNSQVIATLEDITSFMRRADKDGDGKINYRDFLVFMESKQKVGTIIGTPERKRTITEYASPSLRESNFRSPVSQNSVLTGTSFLKYQVYTPEKTLTNNSLHNYLFQSADNDQVHLLSSPDDDIRNVSSSKHKRVTHLSPENEVTVEKSATTSQAFQAFQSKNSVLTSLNSHSILSAQKPKDSHFITNSKTFRSTFSSVTAFNVTSDEYHTSTMCTVTSPRQSSGIKVSNPRSNPLNYHEFSRKLLLEEETSPKVKSFSSRSHREMRYVFTGHRSTLRSSHHLNQKEFTTSSQKYRIGSASPEMPAREFGEHALSSQKTFSTDYAMSPRHERSSEHYLRKTTRSEKSPIRGCEEEYLTKSIKQIIQLERELEKCKTDLIFKKDFTVASCYHKIINQNDQEAINREHFETNLRNFGVFFTKTEVTAVFERFDNDGDGLINFADFEKVVMPSSQALGSILSGKDSSVELEDRTFKQFISFVKKLAEAESQIADIRIRVSKRFTLEDAFKAIDIKECGYIDVDELRTLLTYYGVFPSSTDLQSLINRIDQDKDGKLSLSEFTKGFSPLKAIKEDDQEEIKEDHSLETKEDDKNESKEESKADQKEEVMKENIDNKNDGEDVQEKPQEQLIVEDQAEEDGGENRKIQEPQELARPNETPIEEKGNEKEEILKGSAETQQIGDEEVSNEQITDKQ